MSRTLQQCATELGLWGRICQVVRDRRLLARLCSLPVRSSRATRSLGAYVSKGAEPVCIRLQFAQETQQLQQTLLHEVAHLCDHLSNQSGRPYRRAHGPGWRAWAEALGVEGGRSGESAAVALLHRQRLKLVAVCQGCGAEFRRVRRLNRNRHYTHPACGGKVLPL